MAIAAGNPYAPPRPRRPSRSGSRPSGRSPYTRALLLALSASLVVGGFRSVLYVAATTGWSSVENLSQSFGRAFLWSWHLKRVLFFTTVVAYSLWIHRANREARDHEAALVLSPGWAVAVSFLPVVNLVAPYRAVREILEAASPSSFRVSSTALARLWWALWIAAVAWSSVSAAALRDAPGLWRDLPREALWALSALALIVIVRRIDLGLERMGESEAGVPGAG